jgi:thiol-disulfide isomerase/thioredoxin
MKSDAPWMLGVASVAAVMGAVAYWALGPVDPPAAPSTPIIVTPSQSEGVPATKQTSPVEREQRLAAKPFRFGPANADIDDIAEVRFVDADGRRMSLADFRGKQLLLNIWATWCGPCREEMPTLDRLQTLLGSPDFEVMALSIDHDGIDVVREFYAELGLQALRIYVDPSTMATVNLNVRGVPTTLLIDANGREIGRYAGPAEWDGEAAVSAIRERLSAASAGAPTEKSN